MEDRVDTGHGGRKFQFVGCRSMIRDALLDSKGAEEAISELGTGLVVQCDEVGGEADLIANVEGQGTMMLIKLSSLSCLGQVKFSFDSCLYIS